MTLARIVGRVAAVRAALYEDNRLLKPKESYMPTINIDNKDYDFDTLPEEAKAQVASIRFVDEELARLQAQAAVLQTARATYVKMLKEKLPVLGGSDTIKFG